MCWFCSFLFLIPAVNDSISPLAIRLQPRPLRLIVESSFLCLKAHACVACGGYPLPLFLGDTSAGWVPKLPPIPDLICSSPGRCSCLGSHQFWLAKPNSFRCVFSAWWGLWHSLQNSYVGYISKKWVIPVGLDLFYKRICFKQAQTIPSRKN